MCLIVPPIYSWGQWTQVFFFSSFFCLGEEHARSALEGHDSTHCERFSISSAPASPSFGAAGQAWDGHCSFSCSVYTLRRPCSGFGSSLCHAECTGEMSSNDDCDDGKKHQLKLNLNQNVTKYAFIYLFFCNCYYYTNIIYYIVAVRDLSVLEIQVFKDPNM